MISRAIRRIQNRMMQASDPGLESRSHEPGMFPFPGIDELSDSELEHLNNLLPWASWVIDSKGRRFGNRYAVNKRNDPEVIPDHRILELDQRCSLSDKHVLEIGCFEGNHYSTGFIGRKSNSSRFKNRKCG